MPLQRFYWHETGMLEAADGNWVRSVDAKAEIARLRDLLEDALEYMHNPFEPDNQSAVYNRIKAAFDSGTAAPAPAWIEGKDITGKTYWHRRVENKVEITTIHPATRTPPSEWMRETLEKAVTLESFVVFTDGTTATGEEAEQAMRSATDASK